MSSRRHPFRFSGYAHALAIARKYHDFLVVHNSGFVWFESLASAKDYLKEIRGCFSKAKLIPIIGFDGQRGVDLVDAPAPWK